MNVRYGVRDIEQESGIWQNGFESNAFHAKAARGWAVCIVGGVCHLRKMTVQALTSSFDRLRLWATAKHREPSTPPKAGNGFADGRDTERLIADGPCSSSPLPDKEFTTFPPLATCFSGFPRGESQRHRAKVTSSFVTFTSTRRRRPSPFR